MGTKKNKVNPERQRTRYTKEFKLEAVRLMELGQTPATQLALELGMNNPGQRTISANINNNCSLTRVLRMVFCP